MNYFIKTYGCQMNVHESEKIAGIFEKLGYIPCESIYDADIIAFNTCCIRDTAEKKILGNIGELKILKKKKPSLKVIIVGCMSQQKGVAEELIKKFNFINIIIGTNNLNNLENHVRSLFLKGKRIIDVLENNKIHENESLTRTSFPNAWVNIMYGCDNFCSYCIVPYVRGRERSRNKEDILKEVSDLLKQGYKEVTLLGQNVNSYGKDNLESYDFASLLKEIALLPYKFRLRFMTSHPKDLSFDVLKIMSEYDNIPKCLHLPIQSGSNNILKLMNRKYTREYYLNIIKNAKMLMANITFTTDIMVGFPQESELDFQDTLNLLKEVEFSSAFTFVYSKRKGTPAFDMEQIPTDVKKARIQELIATQNEITKKQSYEYIGNIYEILVEDTSSRRKNSVCGRTASGRLVTFSGSADLIGSFVNVKITSSATASLFGELV